MSDKFQGIYDEYQSASIAIDALSDALHRATRFDKPGIRRALMDAIEADMKKEAA